MQTFPKLEGGKRWRVSVDGGYAPLWAPNGEELFYRNGKKMMVVPIETDPTFRPGDPELVFQGPYFVGVESDPHYDIAPDGRFLMIKESEEAERRNELIVVENWFEEVKRLAPVGKS